MSLVVWRCEIGEVDRVKLPAGSDLPMRNAVRAAYRELTGEEPIGLFSGWGGNFSDVQHEVIAGFKRPYGGAT